MGWFDWFKKDTEVVEEEVAIIMPDDIDIDTVKEFSYEDIEDAEYSKCTGEKYGTILLMDDMADQFYLFDIDFKRIESTYGFNIPVHYDIYRAKGDYAGFIAYKLIQSGVKIDIAVLDITLGTSVKLAGGEFIEFDGVDIGLAIRSNWPDANVKFCSAHPLNRKNPSIHEFIDKFEDATKEKMEDSYFSKNSNRYIEMYRMIKQHNDIR